MWGRLNPGEGLDPFESRLPDKGHSRTCHGLGQACNQALPTAGLAQCWHIPSTQKMRTGTRMQPEKEHLQMIPASLPPSGL